jgi:hypothetical protein
VAATTSPDQPTAIDPRLTPNRKLFAQQVSRGTGLNETVVDAWVLAEGGPDDNPLNIGPGQHFGSPISAAAAVVRLLHQPLYTSVLSAANHTPEEQITAIANSPWNGGAKAPVKVHTDYAALIRGVYEHLKPKTGDSGGGVSLPSIPLPGLPDIPNPVGGVEGAIAGVGSAITGAVSGAESWLAGAALSAAAYLLLTLLALVLFVMGVNKLTGGKLLQGAAMARGAGGGAAAAEVIPF